MEGILKFNLPEEQDEFNSAVKGSELCGVIFAIQNEVRRILKYEEVSEETYDRIEKLQGFIADVTSNLGDVLDV